MGRPAAQLGMLLLGILVAVFVGESSGMNGHGLMTTLGRQAELEKWSEASNVDFYDVRETFSFENLLNSVNSNVSGVQLTQECLEDLVLMNETLIDVATKHTSAKDKAFLADPFFKMVDASGKLSPGIAIGRRIFFGMYEECVGIDYSIPGRERRFRGAYIRIMISRTFGNWTARGACPAPMKELGWDICIPKSCENQADLLEVARTLHLPNKGSPVCNVITMEDNRIHQNAGTWIVVAFMIFVGVLGIAASFYDYFISDQCNPEFNKRTDVRIFRSFSLYTNIIEILNVDGSKKQGQINPIHCMRFFSICWVMIGHSLILIYFGCSSNPLEAMQILKDVPSQFLTNAYFAVDTFFFMSGLLLAYMWFKSLKKNRRQTMSLSAWILFYVHRILRLSPPYFMIIVFYTFVYRTWLYNMPQYMTPILPDTCTKNWWINLLYLTNFIDYKDQCYLISWYLATDLQIFIFTPLILVPFAIKPLFGYLVSGLILVLSTAANVISVFHFYFPPSDYALVKHDPRMKDFSKYTLLMYDAPWIRCQIYIIGMILGYILQTKTRPPKINSILNIALWIGSFGLMVAAVLSLYDWTNGTYWNLTARAVYSALSKPAWGLALAWIVFACFYGYGGPINAFMSWEIWVPLGRLSYCAYLIHMCIVLFLPGMKQGDIYFSSFSDAFVSFLLPVIALTFFFSLFWSAAFEVSFAKVENIIISSLMSRPKKEIKKCESESTYSIPDSIPSDMKDAVMLPVEALMELKPESTKL